MTRDEAVALINEKLCIGAGVTHSGTELKCSLPSDEGGTDKAYLDDMECMAISLAFLTLCTSFKAAQHKRPDTEGSTDK